MMRQTAFRHPHTCPTCFVRPGEECLSYSGRVTRPHQAQVDLYLADVHGWIEEHRRRPDSMTWRGLDIDRSEDAAAYRRLEKILEWAWSNQLGQPASSQPSSKAPLGGWTPSYEGDLCGGGHPGGHYDDIGTPRCRRCGRALDLSPCECGEHAPDSALSRSFCQAAMHRDKLAILRHLAPEQEEDQ